MDTREKKQGEKAKEEGGAANRYDSKGGGMASEQRIKTRTNAKGTRKTRGNDDFI